MHWTGYTELRYFDSESIPCRAGRPARGRGNDSARVLQPGPSPRSATARRFPQQLKAEAPRNGQPGRHQPGHRCVRNHALRQSGVLRRRNGVYFCARPSRRRGESRRASGSIFGSPEFLALDTSLDTALRLELQRRVDHLALNPRENDVRTRPLWPANNTPRCCGMRNPRAAQPNWNATGARSWKPTRSPLAGAWLSSVRTCLHAWTARRSEKQTPPCATSSTPIAVLPIRAISRSDPGIQP